MSPLRSIASRAFLTWRLCALLFPVMLLGTFVQSYQQALVLLPCETETLRRIIGIVAHGFIISGVVQWLVVCASILASALVAERNLNITAIAVMWFGSSALGGIAYTMFADDCRPFAGPSAFVWAFAGAASAVAVRNWKQTHLLEKLYFGFILVCFASLLTEHSSVLAMKLIGFSVGVFTVLFQPLQRVNQAAA